MSQRVDGEWMRRLRGVLSVVTVVSAVFPNAGASQGGVTVTPAPGVSPARLPTLELVGVYGGPGSPWPDGFGSGAEVAVGTGNSFAVLTVSDPNVTVWDLVSGKVSQFSVKTLTDGKISDPTDLVVLRDTIIVAGNERANRAAEKYAPDGRHLGSVRLSPDPAETRTSLSAYESSPSGTWILQRQTETSLGADRNRSSVLVRTNRVTGASETLDIPTSLIAGYTEASAPSPFSTPAAISDDGTVAIGFGKFDYRLILIPVDASPRVLGGRAISKPPLMSTPFGFESLRLDWPGLPLVMQQQIAQQLSPAQNRTIVGSLDHFGSGALQFDSKGRLWVNTNRGSYQAPQRSVVDVFSPTLEYLGAITLEGYLQSDYDIGPGLLVTRMSDPKGVIVKVWRIREP